jgi:DnaJ family protein A protein 5
LNLNQDSDEDHDRPDEFEIQNETSQETELQNNEDILASDSESTMKNSKQKKGKSSKKQQQNKKNETNASSIINEKKKQNKQEKSSENENEEPAESNKPPVCSVCNQEFESRNRLFEHIKEEGHAILKTASNQPISHNSLKKAKRMAKANKN